MCKVKRIISAIVALTICLCSTYIFVNATEVTVPSPLARYSFEDTGNLGKDSVGTFNLTNNNNKVSSSDTGVLQKGAYFSCSSWDDGLSVTPNFMSSYENFTVSIYAKLEALPDNNGCLISTGWDDVGGFSFGLTEENGVFIDGRDSSGGTIWNVAVSNVVQTNDFHMYTLSVSDNGKKIEIFVDNKSVLSRTLTYKMVTSNNANRLVIGQVYWLGGYKFKGTIDEVQIFSSGLTLEQVKKVYENSHDSGPEITPSEKTPITLYKFNDTTNVGLDSKGLYNLTNTNNKITTLEAGIEGKAAYFAASNWDDNLSTSPNYMSGLDNFTVSVFAKLVALPDVNGCLISTGWDDVGGFSFGLTQNNGVFFDGRDSTGGTVWVHGNSEVIQTESYHMYTLSISNDGKKIEMYVDTTLIATQTLTSKLNLSNTANRLVVGQVYWQGGYKFKGSMDELMIFDSALSNSEVEKLHLNYFPKEPEFEEKESYYNFDDSNNLGLDKNNVNNLLNSNNKVKSSNDAVSEKAAQFAGENWDDSLYAESNFMYGYDNFTVSVFGKLESLPDGNGCLVSTGWDDIGGFSFGLSDNDTVFFDAADENGNPIWICEPANVSTKNKYHMYTLTVYEGGKNIDIYVDSKLVVSKTYTTKLKATASIGKLAVGQAYWLGGFKFKGLMDELYINNYVLSADKIKDLYLSYTIKDDSKDEIVIPDKTLVAQYTFDNENIGLDSKGRFNLTNNGTAKFDEKSIAGKSLYLSGKGSTDALYYENGNFTKDFKEITVSFYAKLGYTILDNACILSTGWDPNGGISVGFSTDNTLFFDGTTEDGEAAWIRCQAGTSLQNSFHLYTLSISNGGKTISYYIDGKPLTEKTFSSPIKFNSKFGLVIGQVAWYGGYLFNGYIDELSIYNYGLSADEVAKLSGYTRNQEKNLIAYYPFDDYSELGQDAIGSYHLTNSGCVSSYPKGYSGNAAYFAGIDWKDSLYYSGDDFIQNLEEFTVSCYAKFEEVNDNACLFSTGWDGLNGISFGVVPGGDVFVDAQIGTNAVWECGKNTVDVTDGFHNYSISYSANKKSITCYIDGEKVLDKKIDNKLSLDSKFTLTLGQVAWKGGYMLNGLLDEVKVYDKYMTAEEIKALTQIKQEEVAVNNVDTNNSESVGTKNDNEKAPNNGEKVVLPDIDNTKTNTVMIVIIAIIAVITIMSTIAIILLRIIRLNKKTNY